LEKRKNLKDHAIIFETLTTQPVGFMVFNFLFQKIACSFKIADMALCLTIWPCSAF